jgi:hypothetical protein
MFSLNSHGLAPSRWFPKRQVIFVFRELTRLGMANASAIACSQGATDFLGNRAVG